MQLCIDEDTSLICVKDGHQTFMFLLCRAVQDNTYSVCSGLEGIKCQAVTDSDVRMLLKRRGNRHFLLYPAAVGPCVCVCV